MLQEHRSNPACAACHDIIDPIGFGLENYDWLGRWREIDAEGRPVDASGTLPSGEVFNGPAELRAALLKKQDQLLLHVARKVFGYALGRSVSDRDYCVLNRIMRKLEPSNYGARALVREIVLSVPFRFVQADSSESDL